MTIASLENLVLQRWCPRSVGSSPAGSFSRRAPAASGGKPGRSRLIPFQKRTADWPSGPPHSPQRLSQPHLVQRPSLAQSSCRPPAAREVEGGSGIVIQLKACRPSSAIRCCRVDTGIGPCRPPCFPPADRANRSASPLLVQFPAGLASCRLRRSHDDAEGLRLLLCSSVHAHHWPARTHHRVLAMLSLPFARFRQPQGLGPSGSADPWSRNERREQQASPGSWEPQGDRPDF